MEPGYEGSVLDANHGSEAAITQDHKEEVAELRPGEVMEAFVESRSVSLFGNSYQVVEFRLEREQPVRYMGDEYPRGFVGSDFELHLYRASEGAGESMELSGVVEMGSFVLLRRKIEQW